MFSAENSLTLAFKRCPRSFEKNKRLILMYLIPVKMFLGHMPTRQLLEKYNLLQFYEVAEGVKYANLLNILKHFFKVILIIFQWQLRFLNFRSGNLLRLDEALREHEHFFIQCGIFLMLEKLKIITYRNLFKKVYVFIKNISTNFVKEKI